jgi:hypothetical protein
MPPRRWLDRQVPHGQALDLDVRNHPIDAAVSMQARTLGAPARSSGAVVVRQTSAVHLRASREVACDVCLCISKIEFEFELDFRRIAP